MGWRSSTSSPPSRRNDTMTGAAWGLLCLTLLIALADWVAVAADRRPAEYALKPATMVALGAVVLALDLPDGQLRWWYLAAIVASLAGDVFLMLPETAMDPEPAFVAGLGSFLVAHLFYIALFKQGQTWFPSRRSLAATLGAGLAMYVFLFPGLNAVLKGAVAAYVVVIALMAAQAIGRATVLRDKASVLVAVGAVFFMVSDSLLATNKFAVPIPMAQFWVLGTYYMAQILISRNAVPVIAGLTRNPSHAGPPFGARAMDPGSSPG